MVVVVLSYSGKPNADALPASKKNEYKQTVASEESQVEADMINFELMDGHGYLFNKLLVLILALIIFPIAYILIHYITSISHLKQK